MRVPRLTPATIALVLGGTCLVAAAAWLVVLRGQRPGRSTGAPPPAVSAPSVTAPATTAPAPAALPTTTVTAPTSTAPVVPTVTLVAFSWRDAGGILVHPDEIDPTLLGTQLRQAGFGWVALLLGDGGSLTAPDASWIIRFKEASGLAVGGWSVLRDDPSGEAAAAAGLVSANGLAFYIADAEAEYAYTNGAGRSAERYARSRQFVRAFRALLPGLPAAVSSYCRPDQNDLDWRAWAKGGFAFLPQAYSNDFGPVAAPAACTTGAARFFPRGDVHPTVGSYIGGLGEISPAEYVQELHDAGTTGFSVYPAETEMTDEGWQAYGQGIATLGIAAPAAPG